MAKQGQNSPVIGNNGLRTAPGDNSKIVAFGQALTNMKPVDVHDAKKLAQRVNEYFTLCSDCDMKPGVAGLALALSVDRRRLWEVSRNSASGNRVVKDMPEKCKTIIKKAYAFLEYTWESLTQDFKLHPTAAVFLGINNFGYSDVKQISVEQQLPPYNPLGDITDEETLRQRYLSAVPDDIDED